MTSYAVQVLFQAGAGVGMGNKLTVLNQTEISLVVVLEHGKNSIRLFCKTLST
jgi:hypothetical protein